MKNLTVKELRNQLDTLPDDAIVYAYEGEITGIVIVEKVKSFFREIKVIPTKEPSTRD